MAMEKRGGEFRMIKRNPISAANWHRLTQRLQHVQAIEDVLQVA